MLKKNLYFFLSPAIIAVVLFIIVLLMLPPISRYSFKLINSFPIDYDGTMYYYDLDGNGTDEQIISTQNVRGQHAIKIKAWDGSNIEQYNLRGVLNGKGKQSVVCDHDNDGTYEIFGLCLADDSLFLSYFEFRIGRKPEIQEKFITTINETNGMIDFSSVLMHADMNADGYRDILINVKAGFSLQPRQLFCYDLHNDSLWSSPPAGNLGGTTITQLDDDPYPEILNDCSSVGNIPPGLDIPYKDSSAWLMAMDHNLHYLFEPIEFKGYGSQIKVLPFIRGGEEYILAIHEDKSYKKSCPVLLLYDLQGNLADRNPVRCNSMIDLSLRGCSPEDPNYFLVDRQFLYSINEDLKLVRRKDLGNNILAAFNLGDDDLPFGLSFGAISMTDNSLILYDAGFEEMFRISFPVRISNIEIQSIEAPGVPANSISLIAGGINYIYRIKPNGYYKYRFVLLALLYTLILAFIMLMARLQRIRLNKKYQLEKQMTELQIKTIKSQMDPHFTFNALNSISSVIFKEDKETAYKYFNKFSKLVRLTLEDSNQIKRTLEEELEFVENYLELEKFRFRNRLEYRIQIDPDVNSGILIPRMIIQTFVENAVKHGILPKKSKGNLWITIQRTINHLEIEVRDDGVGRKQAMAYRANNNSRGLKIINELIELFVKLEGKRINYTITDLDDPETGTGTVVNVFIPV